MALFASGVNLVDKLKNPLTDINQSAQGSLQTALGRIGTRQAKSNRASGRPMGTYAPAELARAGTQASTGIEDTLRGALGDTSYSDYLKQQEFERNMALAKRIGSLSAPSILEQVLGGLGGAAKFGGQATSLYQALNKGGGSSLPPSLSLYSSGGSGLARYS